MELKDCPYCHIQPVEESKLFMMGKIIDGGYDAVIGRYKCPKCGFAPNWGRCYSILFGFNEKHIEVWNDAVKEAENNEV